MVRRIHRDIVHDGWVACVTIYDGGTGIYGFGGDTIGNRVPFGDEVVKGLGGFGDRGGSWHSFPTARGCYTKYK